MTDSAPHWRPGLAIGGLLIAAVLTAGCEKRALPPNATPSPKALLVGGKLVFSDDFERAEFGADWQTEHAGWTIKEGAAHDTNAKNVGLWLQRELPARTRVEFTARSEPLPGGKPFPGDLKCEIFAKTPTHEGGYVLINGGWGNRLDVIARLDEHGDDRLTRDAAPVEPSTEYRWAVARTDNTVHWFRDGDLVLSFSDDAPVDGRYFGFNNWASNAYYDDLAIYELE